MIRAVLLSLLLFFVFLSVAPHIALADPVVTIEFFDASEMEDAVVESGVSAVLSERYPVLKFERQSNDTGDFSSVLWRPPMRSSM